MKQNGKQIKFGNYAGKWMKETMQENAGIVNVDILNFLDPPPPPPKKNNFSYFPPPYFGCWCRHCPLGTESNEKSPWNISVIRSYSRIASQSLCKPN